MKKKFFISMASVAIMLIVCAGNSQAAVVYWTGDSWGNPGTTNYADGNSWSAAGDFPTPYGTPPLSTDSHGIITPTYTTLIPTISSTIAETPGALGIGWDTDGTLNVVDGASVTFNNVYLPAFETQPNLGTLNISGGNTVITNNLSIGWGISVGTINQSGGTLHAANVTWNNGVVNLSGAASFLINGNQTALNLVSDGKITASEPHYIVEEVWNSGDNRTEYAAIPGPPIIVNPSATAGIYSDKVTVRWDEVDEVDKYQVWRSETDNSSTAADISGDVINPFFNDTTVIQEINYYYWVKAWITNTWSDFGDSALGFSTATPNEKFEDVSVEVGLAELNNANFDDGNIAWVDYNNDGRPDIFTGAKYDYSLGSCLFKNVSGNSFERSGGAAQIMAFSGVFADLDNDGDQDWLSSIAGNHRAFNNNGIFTWAGGPTNAYQAENLAFGDFNNNTYLDFYRPGWESPSSFGYPDSIYTNTGDGSFQFSWQQTSMARWFGANTEKRWLASGRNATTADFDEDGDIDVYVSNYRLSPNFLQINDGAGTFTNLALEYGVEGTKSLCIANGGTGTGIWYGHTIGSTFADLDNDGHLDLIVGNFDHNWSCGSNPNYQDDPRFHRNMGEAGNWHFEDKTANVGLPYVESHACPATADFDNDGDLDFFMTSVAGGYAGQKCTMMRNDGNWNFTDISVEKGLDITTPKSNFQAAWADYDNDGDLDLFTGKKLYRNNLNNGNHWLKIKLIGATIVGSNIDAIGAQARIQLGTETLTRQVESAVGWGNQNERTLHFGLGTETGPVTVNVTWPNGQTSLGSFDVDQTVTMAIPEGTFIFLIFNFIFLIYSTRKFQKL